MYDDFLFRFWWLIFPIMWFVFGMVRMAMRQAEYRAHMDMVKTLVAQGKDPAEVMQAVGPAYPYGRRWRHWW